MKDSILIVEDQFVEADFLQSMLVEAGYRVTGIARSYTTALEMIREERPDFVLLDIFLKGKLTGIDLAGQLTKENIPFVYLSANSSEDILAAAKTTQPYGFLVKPFRQADLLVTLGIAQYRHQQSVQYKQSRAAELLKELTRLTTLPSDRPQKLLKTAIAIQRFIPFDFLGLGTAGFLRVGYEEYQAIGNKELQIISRRSEDEIARSPYNKLIADTFEMRSELLIQLKSNEGQPFPLLLASRRTDSYHADQLSQFGAISEGLAENLTKLMTEKSTVPKQLIDHPNTPAPPLCHSVQ